MYEFYLNKYFDTINLYYLKEMLLKLHLPSALISHFRRWSRTYPINSRKRESRYNRETQFKEGIDYHYYVTKKYVSLIGSSARSNRVTIL